jgi:hypothetical protein
MKTIKNNKRGFMKTVLLFVSVIFLQQTVFAKGSIPDNADYVVPTPAELVEHSRFKVKIEKPYVGDASDTISYMFPAELTGVENQVITLKRIGKTNNWESPEMTAACTESDDVFSCNMYIIKQTEPIVEKINFPFASSLDLSVLKSNKTFAKAHKCGAVMAMSFIDPQNVQNFLNTAGFSGDILDKKLAVSNSFACSEPAGILSYEFK